MLFAVFFFSSMKKVRILSLYCLEIAGIQKNSGIDRVFPLLKFLQSCFDIGLHRLVTTAVPSNSLFIFSSLLQTDSRCFVCECELVCQISVKFCVGK